MRTMVIDRRRLLAGAAGFALCAGLDQRALATNGDTLYLSGRAAAGGGFRLAGFDGSGARRLDLPLPDRGHHVSVRPDGRHGVMVARRPGRYLLVADLSTGRAIAGVAAAEGRGYCGHGCFAADGATFFATENDYAAGRGVVGVYDVAAGYRRIGEFASHGIGPHQLALMPDGRTMVIANGGILTHREREREKLNLPTMTPTLAYVDSRTGQLIDEARLPAALHQLSIRHLAVADDGAVAVGMQYEGPRNDHVPLVGLHHGGEIHLLPPPAGDWWSMRQYCGSIAFDLGGTTIAASSPRGGTVMFWDRGSGASLGTLALVDGCGVAPTVHAGEFMVTSGVGRALRVGPAGRLRAELQAPFIAASHWDNHLTLAGPA